LKNPHLVVHLKEKHRAAHDTNRLLRSMKNIYEIQLVLKDYTKKPTHQITHIGGQMQNGTRWKLLCKEAMENIERGDTQYFIRRDGGLREYLVIGQHPLYGKFLSISGDTREPTTLLAMPEVIAAQRRSSSRCRSSRDLPIG
jgi:hypothetical protein